VAQLALSEQEAALFDVFGARVFLRARAHLTAGEAVDLHWEPQTGQLHGTVRDGRSALATATAVLDTSGTPGVGTCDCRQHLECAHPAALVLAATAVAGTVPAVGPPAAGSRKPVPPAAPPPAWEAALSTLVG
jgi:uncharacterized Zn finger protein